jgi:hypothetical protein
MAVQLPGWVNETATAAPALWPAPAAGRSLIRVNVGRIEAEVRRQRLQAID